jgi:alkanesulfonate monooxygenase SsuD/methylene tetrahydromethanopterin reductase-like flavin-dependent oxidoreductase (luciferase family)
MARNAEEAGYDSIWVMDHHFFQIRAVGSYKQEMLESYSTLAHIAAVTSRVSLGTMVTGVTYRYPGILAKTVTTLDVLSGGRAWLGIGAAWNEQEHVGLGVPFPPVAERSSDWRRRCRSPSRCGATTTGRIGGSTTSWPRR